jgi:hypothetical protein
MLALMVEANPPMIFLSHASEDKEEFVAPLGRALAHLGIRPWLDKWEIKAGDSLIDRLFEEGLGSADAVIVVLSKNSVDKPWVKEELSNAAVRRISKGTRLIPVRLDGVRVPEALTHLAWINAERTEAEPRRVARIVSNAIFDTNLSPTVDSRPQGAAREEAESLHIENALAQQPPFRLYTHPSYPDRPSSQLRRVMAYTMVNSGTNVIAISDIKVNYPRLRTTAGQWVELVRTTAAEVATIFPTLSDWIRFNDLPVQSRPNEHFARTHQLPILVRGGDRCLVEYEQAYELRLDGEALSFADDVQMSHTLAAYFGMEPHGDRYRAEPFIFQTTINTMNGELSRDLLYAVLFDRVILTFPTKEEIDALLRERRLGG